jgi:hypothetical protein
MMGSESEGVGGFQYLWKTGLFLLWKRRCKTLTNLVDAGRYVIGRHHSHSSYPAAVHQPH